jgi:4-hydroxy-tetrahydrodipicolinate synthase
MMKHELKGVYAAAVTPMRKDYSPDLKAIPGLLEFLDQRGCHGALLLGTTGEGPSFSFDERNSILKAACEYKVNNPDFQLLAGTGTPSLTETISLTREAFSMGFDGVVVLPPYYFRKVNDQGLFAWFSEVLRRAVPEGGRLLGYHIPPVTGISFSLDLLEQLKEAFPGKFAGIKDSSADPGFARSLGVRFGDDLLVLNGNDRLFSLALESHAAGCITALANLYSPELRKIWDEIDQQHAIDKKQERIDLLRSVLDNYSPYPPMLKAMLARQHGFPSWFVRPPLMPINKEVTEMAFQEFSQPAGTD